LSSPADGGSSPAIADPRTPAKLPHQILPCGVSDGVSSLHGVALRLVSDASQLLEPVGELLGR
jgi:hypothetical protein